MQLPANVSRERVLSAARALPAAPLEQKTTATHQALVAQGTPVPLAVVREILAADAANTTADLGQAAKAKNVVADGALQQTRPQAPAGQFSAANLALAHKTGDAEQVRAGGVGGKGDLVHVALTAGQTRALALLAAHRPDKPAPLFLFTDPNKDPDDLSVMIGLKFLAEQGFVELKSAVTTLGDADTRTTRALFAKTVFDELGMPGVKVGVGVDYALEVRDATGKIDEKATNARTKDHVKFMETPLLNKGVSVEKDGLALLKKQLRASPDGEGILLINAGMADPAALLRSDPELVKAKVGSIVIMGGVDPAADANGLVVADKRAYNNSTHQDSADYVYRRAQELGIPLTVLTKEATYAAAAPRSFYDGMAATNHPVGTYLKDQQQGALKHLWEGINAGHMPPALNAEWFFKTFTDVDPTTTAGQATVAEAKGKAADFDFIWSNVTKFNLYDPLTLLAAVPGASKLLFEAEAIPGNNTGVKVIGKSSVKDSTLAKDLLSGIGISALNPPVVPRTRTEVANGYPKRTPVTQERASWTVPWRGYKPAAFTDASVLKAAGKWADPPKVSDVTRAFVTRENGQDRPVSTDVRGRPLCPLGRTGIEGRGLLGRWGRNPAGDPVVTRLSESGRLQLLVIERKDSGQVALPGGMVDGNEQAHETVARELREETGLELSFEGAPRVFEGVVDDRRNTDNAWMETTALHKHLSPADAGMSIKAGDDARAVKWVDVDDALLAKMYASHSSFVQTAADALIRAGSLPAAEAARLRALIP